MATWVGSEWILVGLCGSLWVVSGQCSMGRGCHMLWFGLFGLKHNIVEKSGDVMRDLLYAESSNICFLSIDSSFPQSLM